MNSYRDIIIAPVITEKSALLEQEGKYVFKVDTKANKVQIAQLADMCSNIINNISNVDISQVLRISNNINYAEDYNKFDFDLFFSTLQYTAYNDFIATKNLNSYKIYIFTAQYLQKLLYKNISKESFLLGYLSELKIFLG